MQMYIHLIMHAVNIILNFFYWLEHATKYVDAYMSNIYLIVIIIFKTVKVIS